MSVVFVLLFISVLWYIIWKLFLRRFSLLRALFESKPEESVKRNSQETTVSQDCRLGEIELHNNMVNNSLPMKASENDMNNMVVLPGDVVTSIVSSVVSEDERVKLGPGLRQVSGDVVASKTGVFRYKAPSTFWVESRQKRYVPTKGETVLGVVMGKVGEAYKVDIGSSDYVSIIKMFRNLYVECGIILTMIEMLQLPRLVHELMMFEKLLLPSIS